MRRLLSLALLLILTAALLGQDKQPSLPVLVLDAGGHTAIVKRVLFTADGQQVVTVSQDKTIRLWDVASGEPLQTIRLPVGPADEGAIHAAALSADGKLLAVGGMPFGAGRFGVLIHVVSLETGQVKQVLKGHREIVNTLSFAPDGKRLASGSNDNTAQLHDLATGKMLHELKGHAARIYNVAWSPDGKRLVTASQDKTARIWSATTGKMEVELKGPDAGSALSTAWSPDGKTVAVGYLNAAIGLYEPAGKLRKTVTELKNQITSVTFTLDSKRLLYTGVGFGAGNESEFAARIVDVATGKETARFAGHRNTVMQGAISRDGKLAASTGGDNHDTFIWNTADGSLVQHLVGRGQTVWGAAWSADGKSIAWGTTNRGRPDNGTMPIERTFHLDELSFGDPPDNSYRRVTLTRGKRSVQRGPNFSFVVAEQGKPPVALALPGGPGDMVYCFTMLSEDRAVVGSAFGLYLIDLATNKLIRTYRGHSGSILSMATSPGDRYFVTGATDQTLRIWDPQQEEPLLSLFFAGEDWIAWTPEGYYAASANGERLMGWQINNGAEQVASYHPASMFRRSLYHPDVIKLVVPAGSVQKALALAGKDKKKPIESVTVAQVLPPSASIVSPTPVAAQSIKQAKFDVKATAKSAGKFPVTAMRLLVDGRPYLGDAGVKTIAQPKLGEVQQSWTVELSPGRHTLAVLAESGVSKGLSPILEVNCTAGKAEPATLYVLAVGISAYPGSMKLDWAAADAIGISKALQDKAGKVFKKVEVKLVTDKEATRASILKGLEWLGSSMTPRDVGVFFFAGHGDRDAEGVFHLVPVDINPRNAAATCVSGDLVKKSLANMPGRVIALLDACHSGAAAEASKRPKQALADDLVRDLVTEEYGIIVMSSSLGREYSLESAAVKHGFFTYALLEGLSGRADINRDGAIYLAELDGYAARRVKVLSQDQQHPVTAKPAYIRPFVLARP